MAEINIKVEVHCERPTWALKPNSKYSTSRYRVYVDNDLITERDWAWNNSTFICEDIWIRSDEKDHVVRVDPVVRIPTQASFCINAYTANVNSTVEVIDDLQVILRLR